MTLQRRLQHAILALLGLAALVGIGTIFYKDRDFLGRVAGTLVVAAIAIALAIPASKKLSVQSERTAGHVLLLAIVIAFVLGVASIWQDKFLGLFNWHLPVTTLAYCVCIVPALRFLPLVKQPNGRICGIAGVAFSSLCFLSWLLAIWFDYFKLDDHSVHFFKSLGLLAGSAFPICACLFGELNDRKHWRWIGVLTGAAAIAMGLAGIWLDLGGKPTNIIHCLIVSTVIGGSNILLRLPLPSGQRWLALATTGSLVATGFCGIFVNYIIDGNPNTGFEHLSVRILAAGSIVTVCGILAITVLKAFNRRATITEAQSINDIKQITLSCPRCSKKQDAALGESRCSGCGIIFLLKVAEPHCIKCNYTLLDIRAGRCPECGEPIGATQISQSPLIT